ncbi:MAG: hypothetical protein CM15mP122_5760 [Bacteroidota bacterium]|nr:MAG: hypothetical protein CM15mP122_5760 [Bacteroidota bacterium]
MTDINLGFGLATQLRVWFINLKLFEVKNEISKRFKKTPNISKGNEKFLL